MQKRIILIIAIMLGLLSAIVSYKYLQYSTKTSNTREMLRVVVAVKEIQPKERVNIDQVMLKEIPQELAHLEAANSFDQVVGFYAKERILTGEQVLKPRLIKGFADYGLVVKIPQGYRAMTIPVDKVAGIAGFIRPGDFVDIIVGFDQMTAGKHLAKVLLEKVLVLASAQELAEDKRKPENVDTITLAVTSKEAEELALALDHGIVRVVLRPLETKEAELGKLAEVILPDILQTGTGVSIKVSTAAKKAEPQVKKESIFRGANVEIIPQLIDERELQKWANSLQTDLTSPKMVTNVEPDADISSGERHTVEIIRGIERTSVMVWTEEAIVP